METLRPFSIPIKGLKTGTHSFEFRIDKTFFDQFEGSPVEDGNFKVLLNLDKRHDTLTLDFDFAGTIPTDCDRCLAPIQLPVSGREELLVKVAPTHRPEEADVIYVTPDDGEINVAKYIYEFISLSVPYIARYDCQNDQIPPCDFDLIKRLEDEEKNAAENSSSIWDHLKDNFRES